MAPSKSTTKPHTLRRFPIGVEILDRTPENAIVHARVWAPDCDSVELVITDDSAGPPDSPLIPEGNGYFSGFVANVGAGTRYRFRLDGGAAYPDPASRYQPEGPHGPSMVIDPAAFAWTDSAWPGLSIEGQVIYELHIGTFTRAGTFRAAIEKLPALAELGITVVELMPLADFAGRFGWGYDGVNEFAPTRLYGTPDDLRAFVDAAHGLGLGVILDVVYNHLGPDGNYLTKFSSSYFSKRPTEWGDAINFDGEHCAPVREFFVSNARYWIEEFHFDGLRLDATQQIFDDSTPHILVEVVDAVRSGGRAGARRTIVIAENEPQAARLARPRDQGGFGLDALWNDDFHHSAIVMATGRSEAYYSGYRGTPQEFVSAVKYGFLYQGEWYRWQRNGRGTPALDLPPARFVAFTQNHDQVANSHGGERLHQQTSPGRARALTALLLLAPHTPMLFQGQEFASSSPFMFFADHHPELAQLVRAGRYTFLSQFPSIAAETSEQLPDPADRSTFTRCKLEWSERDRNAQVVALHRDLLRLRREEPALEAQALRGVDGAVLGEQAFVLRFFGPQGDDRLLLVNFGPRVHLDPIAEPLIAPRGGTSHWVTVLSTDSPEYGGWGTPPVDTAADGWWLPAECAVLLRPSRSTDAETTAR